MRSSSDHAVILRRGRIRRAIRSAFYVFFTMAMLLAVYAGFFQNRPIQSSAYAMVGLAFVLLGDKVLRMRQCPACEKQPVNFFAKLCPGCDSRLIA